MTSAQIINNNFVKNPKDKYIIKSIVFEKDKYLELQQHTVEKYSRFNTSTFKYNNFQAWTFLAIILGIFTGHGDTSATLLFYNCLIYDYLPRIYTIDSGDTIKVCICIVQKEFDEQKNKYKGTATSS